MSSLAQEARDAAQAKIKRLTTADPHQKVDSSTWSPPDSLESGSQTGMRVLSRRAFASGGKVQGMASGGHAGRMPRASGGLTATSLINRNVKTANEEREGTKHTGGLKRGGRAHKDMGGLALPSWADAVSRANGGRIAKAGGGSMLRPMPAAPMRPSPMARREGGRTNDDVMAAAMKDASNKGFDPYNSQPAQAKSYKKLTGSALPTRKPDATSKLVGSAMRMAQKQGVDPYNSQPSQAKAYDKLWKLRQRKEGGKVHADAAEDKKLIKSEMAKHGKGCTCAKCSGGRIGKAEGGATFGNTRPQGGRVARKEGGRAKKGMNVNIIIAPSPKPSLAPPMMPPGAPSGPVGLHQGAPPPPMAAAGAGPAMGPPAGMPPQMRKRGGRTGYPIESGAGGGMGRLEKRDAYGP